MTDGPVMIANVRLFFEQIQVSFGGYCKAFIPAQAVQFERRLHDISMPR
jgi:hypothetical protein